jgi:hypothetical protein
MHIAILTFQLVNTTADQFKRQCDELAPILARTPGLVSKIWLADAPGNTFGGVYTWTDRAAFQAFAASAFAKSLTTNPNVTSVTLRDYSVLDGPTSVTRGLAG